MGEGLAGDAQRGDEADAVGVVSGVSGGFGHQLLPLAAKPREMIFRPRETGQVEPSLIRGSLTTMTPATRLCPARVPVPGRLQPDSHRPAYPCSDPVRPVPSASASPTSEPALANPSYGLVNDTGVPVRVTGCGPACPRTGLAPGAELDFSLGYGRVTVHLAHGKTTCLQIINGIVPATPQPRQILRISKKTSASAC